jgi:hypothetical protein
MLLPPTNIVGSTSNINQGNFVQLLCSREVALGKKVIVMSQLGVMMIPSALGRVEGGPTRKI